LLPESAEEFLGSIMGLNTSLIPLKQLLIERTDRNPFFLQETVSTLIDTEVLAGEPGAYRLAKPITAIQVPATVQAVLASRIDRLPLEEKRLLQCAAVIGKHADLKLLQAISEIAEGNLHAALAHLQAVGFLYESRHLPDVEYTFRHELTYEVAYGGLVHDRRRILHALIAERMGTLYPNHLSERVERLAHHAFQGELWEDAATYLRQAGTKSFVQSVYRSAAARFEEALIALQHLPSTRQTTERLIDVRLDLRNSLLPVGEVETVLRHLHEAGRLADSIGDKRRAGWVFGYMSACSWALGDYLAALDSARRTLALAKHLGDDQLRIYGNLALTWVHHSLGEYREGVKHGHEVVELLHGPRTRERIGIPSLPAVLARTWLISCLAELGEFARALALAEEGVGLAQDLGEPWTLVDAHLGRGILELRRGNLATATRFLEEGLGICRRFNIDVWFTPMASSLGYTYALAGKLEEGTALLKHALDKAAATKLKFYHSLAVIWLGETHLLANRLAEARKLAAEAFELCHACREAGNRAYAERLLGDIASHPGVCDAKGADDHYRQALAAASELGMRPLIAQCHLSRGQLNASTHRFAEAKEELSASLAIFNQLGMTQQAERSAFALEHLSP
jgi:tetratricopeptide (TPR) repeat protein